MEMLSTFRPQASQKWVPSSDLRAALSLDDQRHKVLIGHYGLTYGIHWKKEGSNVFYRVTACQRLLEQIAQDEQHNRSVLGIPEGIPLPSCSTKTRNREKEREYQRAYYANSDAEKRAKKNKKREGSSPGQ